METLFDLTILFGLAIAAVLLFRALRFPAIIGFLVTGLLAGPYALALIAEPREVEQLAEIGVVLLLFTIGIEFSLKEFGRVRNLVLWGGGMQVLLTILGTALALLAFGLAPRQAVFFGFLVSLSSTAIVLKLMLDAGEMDTPQGKAALGILIFQDLCVVPLMLFTPLLGAKEGGAVGGEALLIAGRALVVGTAIFFAARFLIPLILRRVVASRSREILLLAVFFTGFGTAFLTAQVGLSLALGAFIAGLAISESEYSQQVLGYITPFRDVFISLFFISVGMLLDPGQVLASPGAFLLLLAAIVAVKLAATAVAGLAFGLPLRIAVVTSFALAQVGEFSFVLAREGERFGLLPGNAFQLFLAASVGTMALTPLLMGAGPRVADLASAAAPPALLRGRSRLGQGRRRLIRHDHVIIAGYGLNGRNLARILEHLGIPFLIVDCNPFGVMEGKKRGAPIIFGDASTPEVLELAQVRTARILVVAISDVAASRRIVAQARSLNPRLHLIVRTRYIAEVEPLLRLGAGEVVPEEFESSVEILSRVLRKFLLPQDAIEQAVAEVRRDGYEMLRGFSRRHAHAGGIGAFLSGAEVGVFRVEEGAELAGKTLRQGVLRSRSGATIVAVKRGPEVTPNPDPVWELAAGDVVLLLGTPQQLAAARPLLEKAPPR